MMNNWYNRIMGQPSQSGPKNTGAAFQNPIQQAQYIANAMRNPVAFVKEQFPDVPDSIANDSNAVLNYLSQTRGSQFVQQMQQVGGSQRR